MSEPCVGKDDQQVDKTFPLLVEAVSCLFKGEQPDLSWLTQHESLPVLSIP